MQDRQVKPDATAPGQINVGLWVYLAIVSQVNADVASPFQVWVFQQIQCELVSGLSLLLERKRSSLAT